MASSIAEALAESARILEQAGVPDARREAGSLLAHVLDRDRTFIIAHPEQDLADEVLESFWNVVDRRAAGEPLQYITGYQEFFGLKFRVSPDVLIPRPETELLVETALDLLTANGPTFICDVGTGSGCIAVSLLHSRPLAKAVALDVSAAAISIARQNARDNKVADRIEFAMSDCFGGIASVPGFDVVVSNPPYVDETVMGTLQREVRDFEPRVALTPGTDGLSVIKRLLKESYPVLKVGGHLLIEIGYDQRDRVMEFVDQKTWRLLEIYKDLQGIPRTLTLEKVAS